MSTVRDILDRKGTEVATVEADASALDAARIMNERGIGGVVVVEAGAMIGIFTERDILRRVVAARRDPAVTRTRDIMTAPVLTCRADTPLEECVALITTKRIRHVPVTDENGLSGIITSGDILAHQVREQKDTIAYLNSYVHDLR